jgi:hypothetical protein
MDDSAAVLGLGQPVVASGWGAKLYQIEPCTLRELTERVKERVAGEVPTLKISVLPRPPDVVPGEEIGDPGPALFDWFTHLHHRQKTRQVHPRSRPIYPPATGC